MALPLKVGDALLNQAHDITKSLCEKLRKGFKAGPHAGWFTIDMFTLQLVPLPEVKFPLTVLTAQGKRIFLRARNDFDSEKAYDRIMRALSKAASDTPNTRLTAVIGRLETEERDKTVAATKASLDKAIEKAKEGATLKFWDARKKQYFDWPQKKGTDTLVPVVPGNPSEGGEIES